MLGEIDMTYMARVKKGRADRNLIESLLNNPICCSYLLAYAESSFCTENIGFVLEVKKFQTELLLDNFSWIKNGNNWKEIDKYLASNMRDDEVFTDEENINNWPSRTVSRDTVETQMAYIWDTFLSNTSNLQICMSDGCQARIKKRMNFIHIYGPYTFDEALGNPLATILWDIYPRFKKSIFHEELMCRLSTLNPLPVASALICRAPKNLEMISQFSAYVKNAPNPYASNFFSCWFFRGPSRARVSQDLELNSSQVSSESEVRSLSVDIEFEKFLKDEFLYKILLSYLESIVASEKLLCLRMVHIYKMILAEGSSDDIKDCAWTIFAYFVIAQSSYEIGLAKSARNNIMYELALPTYTIFDELYEQAQRDLLQQFKVFKATSVYQRIPFVYMERFNELKQKSKKRFLLCCKSEIDIDDFIVNEYQNSSNLGGIREVDMEDSLSQSSKDKSQVLV